MTDHTSGTRSPVGRLRTALSSLGERLGEAFPGGKRTYPLPPGSIVDDEGRRIDLRAYDGSAFEALVGMYVEFDPAQRPGTPPAGEDAVREWLDGTLLSGPSVVAWATGGNDDRTVGHVAFVPDDTGKHELAISVHQDYQRAGIGHARERDVSRVWLTVEPRKRGIGKFYSDHGFDTVDPYGQVHRTARYL